MTNLISLEKKAEKVGILLTKKGINQAPIMRVGIAIDVSGSMSQLYSSGALQTAFDQMMGVAVKFDDNGELDVFQFNTDCKYIGTSNPSNYSDYVRKNISISGGTNYGPIVEQATNFFFGGSVGEKKGFLGGLFGKKAEATPASTDNTPVLMLVLTDGEPNDRAATQRLLEQNQSRPIYWHFVGIGGNRRSFPTIAKLADALPNVGEVYLDRLQMSDDEIYEQLICDELVQWIGGYAQGAQAARG